MSRYPADPAKAARRYEKFLADRMRQEEDELPTREEAARWMLHDGSGIDKILNAYVVGYLVRVGEAEQ